MPDITSFEFLEPSWAVEGTYTDANGATQSVSASASFQSDFSEMGIQGTIVGTFGDNELEIYLLQNSGRTSEQLIFADNIRSTLNIFTGGFSNSEFLGNDSESNARLRFQNITEEEFNLVIESTENSQVIFDLTFTEQSLPTPEFSSSGSIICSDDRSNEHDFILGNWDVIDAEVLQNGNIERPGTMSVQKILSGCGLLFNRVMASVVEGEEDFKITSLRLFDYQREEWVVSTLTESNVTNTDFTFYRGSFVDNQSSVTFNGVDQTSSSKFVYDFANPNEFRESHQVFISSSQEYRDFFISDFTLKN